MAISEAARSIEAAWSKSTTSVSSSVAVSVSPSMATAVAVFVIDPAATSSAVTV